MVFVICNIILIFNFVLRITGFCWRIRQHYRRHFLSFVILHFHHIIVPASPNSHWFQANFLNDICYIFFEYTLKFLYFHVTTEVVWFFFLRFMLFNYISPYMWKFTVVIIFGLPNLLTPTIRRVIYSCWLESLTDHEGSTCWDQYL